MKLSQQYFRINTAVIFLIGFLSIGPWGCTNVQHQVKFNKDYVPGENVSIKVSKVVNDTGMTFDIDIEEMLADALEDQLLEEDLLWLGGKVPVLIMESRITGYRKGSAFKRWLMPGWGATELSIRAELKDDKNNLVGSAIASREVVAGGGYTIGAWKTVFKAVARDVAEDLRTQIESQGYIVRQKKLPERSAETPVATFSPVKVDPTEPWTGEWDVQASIYASGRWRMKQTGYIVNSTKDSYFEIKGKVRENQLKGKLSSGSSANPYPFAINLSSDGLSFKGALDTPWRKNVLLSGKKKSARMATNTPVEINPTEPWTGVWRVEGSRSVGGKWGMKQSGQIVTSTGDSYYEIKGKVKGNQVKGTVVGDYNITNKFVLNISSDGQSFKGTITSDWQNMTKQIKGIRE